MTRELLTLEQISALTGVTWRTARKRLNEGGVAPAKVTKKSALYTPCAALGAVYAQRTVSNLSVTAEAKRIVERANSAERRGDLAALTVELRGMQALARAAGVLVRTGTGMDELAD
jgi:hypothetical protein